MERWTNEWAAIDRRVKVRKNNAGKVDVKIAFHQPNYLPNLSFFHKMRQVDLFVIPTSLQFVRREWHNRAKVRGNGGDVMLTIPVVGSSRQSLGDAKMEELVKWPRKHRQTLEMCYRKHVMDESLDRIIEPYQNEIKSEYLTAFSLELIVIIKDLLGVKTELIVDREVQGQKHELLINLCEKYGAYEYLSGLGGMHYMDDDYIDSIRRKGISHEFVGRSIAAEFPYSAAHYLCHHGARATRAIITD